MHSCHYTLSLLKHLLDKSVHTLFPAPRLAEMMHEYEMLANDPSTDQNKIEQTIIRFGKEIWPYHEGLEELYRRHGVALEETRIKEHLAPQLKTKYEQFITAGGSLVDFRRKTDLEMYFSPEEKYELGKAAFESHTTTLNEIASSCRVDRQHECETVIEDHQQKLARIEKKLTILRGLATQSEKWRAEIEDKAQTFEEAFGYLERTFHEDAVDGTIDYYQGVIFEPEFS